MIMYLTSLALEIVPDQLPNGFWIICPGYLTWYFGREIATLLTAAAGIVDSPFAAEDIKAAQKSKKSN